MNRKIFCLGSQRCGTTSLFEAFERKLNFKDKIKEKAFLFKDKIPSGLYLDKQIYFEVNQALFFDFTPEYILHPNLKKNLNKEDLIFVILRNPRTRIISAFNKFNLEFEEISFEEFVTENYDNCIGRSSYSKYLKDWGLEKNNIYIFEEGLHLPLNGILNQLGIDSNEKVLKLKSNQSANFGIFKQPVRFLIKLINKNKTIREVIILLGFKKLYRFIKKYFDNKRSEIKISPQVENIINSLINKESDYLKDNYNIVTNWI